MLNQERFLSTLARHVEAHSLACHGAWKLAESVFLALHSTRNDPDTVYMLYYDYKETARRRELDLGEVLGLLALGGISRGALWGNVHVLHFGDNAIGDPITSPEQGLRVATRLFHRMDGTEISWLDAPQHIELTAPTE